MSNRSRQFFGICPAAGRATRLSPLPGSKELIPIGFHPYEIDGLSQFRPKVVSQYLIENMIEANVSRIFMILGKGKSDVMEFYGDGSRWRTQMVYLFQEVLNGMPFALDLAYPLVQDGVVIFGMPDTIIEPQNAFIQVIERHRDEQADVTLGLFPTNNPQKYGMVKLDQNDIVIECIDKPLESELQYLWGIACWQPQFSAFMHDYLIDQGDRNVSTEEVVLSDIFRAAIQSNMKIIGHRFEEGMYLDIGTSDELDIALRYVLENYPGPDWNSSGIAVSSQE